MIKTKTKTKKIFKVLEEFGFHAIDAKHLEGYFIFEHGDDMVVHFRIKECKGWLFGIWWDLEDENKYEFFAQYEESIDKFKPTASTFVKENLEYINKINELRREIKWDVLPIIKFIRNHPYVAWCYDVGYIRDCWDYVTGFEAFRRYWKHKWDSYRRKRTVARYNAKYLGLVKQICEECLVNYRIIDGNKNGVRCFPRYTVICEGFVGEDVEKGYYEILSVDVDERLARKMEKYDAKAKESHFPEIELFNGGLAVWVKK